MKASKKPGRNMDLKPGDIVVFSALALNYGGEHTPERRFKVVGYPEEAFEGYGIALEEIPSGKSTHRYLWALVKMP